MCRKYEEGTEWPVAGRIIDIHVQSTLVFEDSDVVCSNSLPTLVWSSGLTAVVRNCNLCAD